MKQDQIVSLWINHTNLLWSRLQTASAIEAGVLAAAYQIHDLHKYWASILLIVAVLLLIGVLLLMTRDVQHLDAFKKSSDDGNAIPAPPENLSILDVHKTWKIPDGGIRRIGGRHIGFAMIVVLIVLDIIAAWCFSGFHFRCPCSN